MTLFENSSPYSAGKGDGEDGGARSPLGSEFAAQGVAQVVITAVLVVVAFAAGWFGNSFVNRAAIAQNADERLILQAWDYIDRYYVVTGAIDHKKMAYAAIDAMVGTLNDTGHSRFETPEQIAQEQQQLENKPTVGIGVELTGGGQVPFQVQVIFPNSPASKSDLRVGDVIVAVNGQDVQGKDFSTLHNLISGQAGTPVTLTVKRTTSSGTQTLDVTIIRGDFTPPTVEYTMLPGTSIADISIVQFTSSADADLQKALKDALDNQHATGIILDLRGNPGGYLDQAVSVASQFIPSGKNVLIQRTRDSSQTVPAESGGLATKTPLVVLVDGQTASAAEIVTGAIKVNRPQVHVVGQTTTGTGTILQTLYLADGSALVLGTGEWLLPNGDSIYHKGITPDQPVALPSDVEPLSPLVIKQQHLTQQQVQNWRDAQLLQAIHDVQGQG